MIHSKHRVGGFTIVELLVVIVVIGIIAGITIVSYSAITNNAKKQTTKTDAQTMASQLQKYKSENGSYPSDLADISNAPRTDSTFQYTYTSTTDSYCLTASVPGASANVRSGNSAAKEGGCAGHGIDGQPAVVNLATNPSAETNYTGVSGYYSSPLSTRAVIGDAVRGSYQFETITNSTANPQGLIHQITAEAKASQAYRCSLSVRGTAGTQIAVSGRYNTSAGAYISEGGGQQTVTLSAAWQRVNLAFTTPANTGILMVQYRLTTAATGITIRSDAIICTEGTTQYTYGDGTSTNWAWLGTPHASASSGPAL